VWTEEGALANRRYSLVPTPPSSSSTNNPCAGYIRAACRATAAAGPLVIPRFSSILTSPRFASARTAVCHLYVSKRMSIWKHANIDRPTSTTGNIFSPCHHHSYRTRWSQWAMLRRWVRRSGLRMRLWGRDRGVEDSREVCICIGTRSGIEKVTYPWWYTCTVPATSYLIRWITRTVCGGLICN
jgi:hypothetical protein